jgi:hypothetical protein
MSLTDTTMATDARQFAKPVSILLLQTVFRQIRSCFFKPFFLEIRNLLLRIALP